MRKQDLTPAQLAFLEGHLAGTLKPVQPPGDFIRRLRSRIQFPDRAYIVDRLQDWRRLLVVFASVISGVLVVVTIARGLFYLFGRRNIA
jgi:hypothetical protein